MSWINDVKEEIKSLEVSSKKLKNFGLLIGGIFLLISCWTFISNPDNLRISAGNLLSVMFAIIGIYLFTTALFSPLHLKTSYKIWMGFAFALGWLMSRVLLLILFYCIVLPLSLLARLLNKTFLDLEFRDNKDSYWIPKKENSSINYNKMY